MLFPRESSHSYKIFVAVGLQNLSKSRNLENLEIWEISKISKNQEQSKFWIFPAPHPSLDEDTPSALSPPPSALRLQTSASGRECRDCCTYCKYGTTPRTAIAGNPAILQHATTESRNPASNQAPRPAFP
jgi:hypothetical protein